jgi:hypothetical protein
MANVAILPAIQWQREFLAQELQLLLLQLDHRHSTPSLTGLPQRREDQFQARLLREKVQDDLGAPPAFLKGVLQQVRRANRLVMRQGQRR